MSAWKSLSDELDPDVRTFTDRLRLVIDRSGLGVVAVAERTGHDRADWDAYLHARRPVPRSAVVALSDITGADLGPLTAQWEHADRAWKRALRARAVPEQPTPQDAPDATDAPGGVRDADRAPEGVRDAAGDSEDVRGGADAAEGVRGGADAAEGVRGGWPVAPVHPGGVREGAGAPEGTRGGADAPEGVRGGWPVVADAPGGVRDGARAPEGVAGAGGAPGGAADAAPATGGVRGGWPVVAVPQDARADRTMRIRPVPPIPAPAPAAAPASAPAPAAPRKARRGSPLLYVAGIVGAALVVTAAVLLVDLGGSDAPPAAAPTPSATTTPTPTPSLPDGVRCTGADCGGEDPETMGCGGPLATTVARTRIGGALVEVRHSAVCAAAWARISEAAAGDEVSVQAGTAIQVANVPAGGDTDAYTAMIPVGSPTAARACARVGDGTGDGCTGE
ncbi:DUF2690 domain-containing protein [Streptomyces sp. NPDC085466]|uniref:DUF2690 domain-containing protein n=1 Tax=Streptomyces sp. NPDC085466 TaxID=3365725 RepID=UPI0037D3BE10